MGLRCRLRLHCLAQPRGLLTTGWRLRFLTGFGVCQLHVAEHGRQHVLCLAVQRAMACRTDMPS